MTTAAPAPVAPGPKGAPPRTAPRPSKRNPSDQHHQESPDSVANGGPALAFLAILQNVPKTVTPTLDHGSPPSQAAGTKTGPAVGMVVAPARPSGQPATEPIDVSGVAAGPLGAGGASTSAATRAGTSETASKTNRAGAGAPNRPQVEPAPTPGQPAMAALSAPAAIAGGEPPNARSRGAGPESSDAKPTVPTQSATGARSAPVAAVPGGAATGQGQAQTASGERAPFGPPATPGRPAAARPGDASTISPTTGGSVGTIAPNVAAGAPAWDRTKSPDHTQGDGKKAATGSDGIGGTGSSQGTAAVTTDLAAGPAASSVGNTPAELAQTVPTQVIQQLLQPPPRANTTVVLRLDPPMLGSVVLRVVAGGGNRIRLHFEVDDPSVGDALTGGLGRLESALRAQGLSPEGLSVGLNNTQLGSGPSGQSGQESPRSFAGPRDRGTTLGIQPSSDPVSAVRANGGRYIDYLL